MLRVLHCLMAPRAIGLIQIRFDNGNLKYAPKESRSGYAADFVYATSYPIEEFWDGLTSQGFVDVQVVALNSRTNYATFAFVKR